MLSIRFKDNCPLTIDFLQHTVNQLIEDGNLFTNDDPLKDELEIAQPFSNLTVLEIEALAWMAEEWSVPIVIRGLPLFPSDLIVMPVTLTITSYTHAKMLIAPLFGGKMKASTAQRQLKAVESKLKRIEPYNAFWERIEVAYA